MRANIHSKSGGRQMSPYRQPLTVGELTHIVQNLDFFRSSCEWIENYLARPHAQLGRTGSVCPFAAPALAKDSLQVAVVRLTQNADRRTQVLEAVAHYRQTFLSIRASGAEHMLHSILIVFPDVSVEDAPELIDRTKEELKSSFVEQGLMLGEFHARNGSPGLHNPSFTPLRSPIPMLVIRRMVTTDFSFLNRPEYDAATRLRYIEIYLRVSGIAESAARKELENTVAALRAELQNVSCLP